VFVLPRQRAYVLASDMKARPIDGLKRFADATDKITRVGEGDDFFAVGAHIALDPESGDLLSEVLPPLLHIGSGSSEASAMRWLLDQLVKESVDDRPGATLASNSGVITSCSSFVIPDMSHSFPGCVHWRVSEI